MACRGLQIDDLHALVQHFKEVHVVADQFGHPQQWLPVAAFPATHQPVRTQLPFMPHPPTTTVPSIQMTWGSMSTTPPSRPVALPLPILVIDGLVTRLSQYAPHDVPLFVPRPLLQSSQPSCK
ncbi:hypothetical protein OG21DRAFT_1490041 [Imleria badia]|nr:hypothetical protein OG21DRAFT_1490041 [Imleria badia]